MLPLDNWLIDAAGDDDDLLSAKWPTKAWLMKNHYFNKSGRAAHDFKNQDLMDRLYRQTMAMNMTKSQFVNKIRSTPLTSPASPTITITTSTNAGTYSVWCNATTNVGTHNIWSNAARAINGTSLPSLPSSSTIDNYYSRVMAPDEVCSSEEYALNHIYRFLAANSLTLDDLAKAYGHKFALQSGEYNLPGGAVLKITDTDYTIDDSNHQTIYKANTNRDFNEFLNVSDVLEKFMEYIASLKLTRQQFMDLPIQLFLLWLVIQAAKKDGEPPPEPEVKQLELALEPLQLLNLPAKATVINE